MAHIQQGDNRQYFSTESDVKESFEGLANIDVIKEKYVFLRIKGIIWKLKINTYRFYYLLS